MVITLKERNEKITEFFNTECLQHLGAKGADYMLKSSSGDEPDAYNQFIELSKINGQSVPQNIYVYMHKHWFAITNAIHSDNELQGSEKLPEKLIDLANYALLIRAFLYFESLKKSGLNPPTMQNPDEPVNFNEVLNWIAQLRQFEKDKKDKLNEGVHFDEIVTANIGK